MHPHGFHHASLSVRDCDASADWYHRVLGFEEAFREGEGDLRACVMRFPGGNIGIGLVQHGASPQRFDPAVIGMDHLAFTAATRDELDGWVRHFDDLGVEHSGAIDVPIGAILNFKDPDGIALALFWDKPGA